MGGVYNNSVNPTWYNLQPRGRIITASLNSDCRTTAGSAYVLYYDLWSAGQDGAFNAQRDSLLNRDNLSITRYLRNLQ